MARALLNDDQQLRVGTHLDLLTADLIALERLPELQQPGAPDEAIHVLLAEIRRREDAMGRALDLPDDHPPSLKRRLAVLVGVWAAHLEDLRVTGLRAYGAVSPDLAAQLDPHLNGIVELLYQLADTADRLPEG
jgi:predicted component of type VI protein secretion system